MGTIFISYRREDSQGTSDRIYDWLSQRISRDKIAYDVESIPPGVNFAAYIGQSISASSVVLVIIGRQWLTLAHNGTRRLDNPDDYVRREIETALKQGQIRQGPVIIPLLVDEATMPSRTDLPLSIAELAIIQALPVRRNPDFDRDMSRLYQLILPLIRDTSPPPNFAPPPPASAPTSTAPAPKRRSSSTRLVVTLAIIVGLLGSIGYGFDRLISHFLNQNSSGQDVGPRPTGATDALILDPVTMAIQQCATIATAHAPNPT